MARSPPRRRYESDSRAYRDDRDRDRSYRRRSPSREPRRNDRDRDRGDATGRDRTGHNDRHRADRYHDERRDHQRRSWSREQRERPRHQSREVSPLRDGKEHGQRRRRGDDDTHDNRDRHKRRRHESSDKNEKTSRPTTASSEVAHVVKVDDAKAQEEQRVQQQQRQARMAAWKEKILQERQQKEATENSTATTSQPGSDPNPSSPPRTKFDPKAVRKQTGAKSKNERTTLDGDAAVPVVSNGTSQPATAIRQPTTPKSTIAPQEAKIAGFGLNKSITDKHSEKSAAAKSAALDEDEVVQLEFRKLPDAPHPSDAGEGEPSPDVQNADEDGDGELRSDEEEAEAARDAALKRAADASAKETDEDSAMAEAPEDSTDANTGAMDADSDIDPLDAFMNNLMPAVGVEPISRMTAAGRGKSQVFDDDDGPNLDTLDDNPEDLLNGARRKKKEIPPTDHSKVDYEPFRKAFYTESIEIADMTKDEVTALRGELDNITVRGIDPPRPITKWSQCGFGAQMLDVIRENKFETPTSIQSQALPAIMAGRDVIGVAKTGSGKTLAFILPMFRHIKDQRPVANLEGPIGLIMAPTRELAVQIHRECKPYMKALGLRGVCAYGGAPIKDQIAELKRGAEIVVCTPGRMLDLLEANGGRVTNCRRITYTVLDEADRMFDMGFEPQINKILGHVRPDRQTVLFSATFPKKMESLARKALNKPVEIVVGGRSVVASEITQVIEVRTEESKFHRVLELLGNLHNSDEDARSLIFVERQETADHIFKELTKKGYPSAPVHGGREQIDRDQALTDFKSGAIPVMVATSVAARGLDVKQLKLVINYDCPNHGEDYVHRAGRTGRAGNTGTAVTLVTPEQDQYAGFLIRCLEESKQEVPAQLKEMALSHKKKVEAGQASKISSGFGGHGIEKFDSARAAERAWEKGLFKTGDEPEEETDEAKKTKDKKDSDVAQQIAQAAGKVTGREDANEESGRSQPEPKMSDELAAHLANALKVSLRPTEEVSKAAANDPVARAAAAAAAISSRLGNKGASRLGAPVDNRGPDAGDYHATLEINDFPQKARWAVTNRTNVAKVLEDTGVSITSKGEFYDPAKPRPIDPNIPKLYILVEGNTEIAVQSAMQQLSKLLKEGYDRHLEDEARLGTSGRYKVPVDD